jgi:hypothetical protein
MLIKQPLGNKVKEMLDAEGYVSFEIEIPLMFLIAHDMEELNDYMNESVLWGEDYHGVDDDYDEGDMFDGSFEDITYKVVGSRNFEPDGSVGYGKVILNVHAKVCGH